MAAFLKDPDMAFITPIASPGVPDDPVVILESDDLDAVVKVCSAFVAIDNSSAVELEDFTISLDANWHRLLGDSSSELVVV